MGFDLKLNIYSFSLYPRGKQEESGTYKLRRLFENQCHKDGEEFNLESAYDVFLQKFVNYFDGEFYKNNKLTKAIRLTKDQTMKGVNHRENYIYGLFEGGPTGQERQVFDIDGSEDGSISRNKVTTLDYYFMVWTPEDTNTGYLLIQKYGNENVSDAIRKHFKKFLTKLKHTLMYETYTPQHVIDDFVNTSVVKSVSIRKLFDETSAEESTSPPQSKVEEAKMTLKVTIDNVNTGVSKIKELFTGKDSIVGIDFGAELDDDNNNTELFLEDKKGRTAKSTMEGLSDIRPVFILPNELKADGSESIDFHKTHEFCIEILNKIKKETRYGIK